jgi:hypothetical protein
LTQKKEIMQINDKVVCVDADFSKSWDDPAKHFNDVPILNKVYTVRGMTKAKNNEDAVQLVGIYALTSDERAGFYSWRFAKLEELKEKNKNKQKEIVYGFNLCGF